MQLLAFLCCVPTSTGQDFLAQPDAARHLQQCPDSGLWNWMRCTNGQFCNVIERGWGCCSAMGSERWRCPASHKNMCAFSTCGPKKDEHCCAETNMEDLDQTGSCWNPETEQSEFLDCQPATDAVGWCAEACSTEGYCCNDPTVGSNQMVSCAQACAMRAAGMATSEMLSESGGICDRKGDSGCEIEAVGSTFTMCQACEDKTDICPHGVQDKKECDFGAKLNPPGAPTTTTTPRPQVVGQGQECLGFDPDLSDVICDQWSICEPHNKPGLDANSCAPGVCTCRPKPKDCHHELGCEDCLAGGCVMSGGACSEICFMDISCWDLRFFPGQTAEAACAEREVSLQDRALCAEVSNCGDCTTTQKSDGYTCFWFEDGYCSDSSGWHSRPVESCTRPQRPQRPHNP